MSKARDLANAGTALTSVSATELGYLDGVTSAVQTQIDSKIGSASAINPTIVDAKGDIIAATAADTVARLAVGTDGQVLTADSTAATGIKWATSSAPTQTFTLLNSGGTSLSGTTTTISGLSGYNVLRVFITGGSLTGAGDVTLRLNGDANSKYAAVGTYIESATTYSVASISLTNQTIDLDSSFSLAYSATATSSFVGGVEVLGANSTGIKPVTITGGSSNTNGNARQLTNGIYTGTSVVSSFTVRASGANFDAGTIYVYGAN